MANLPTVGTLPRGAVLVTAAATASLLRRAVDVRGVGFGLAWRACGVGGRLPAFLLLASRATVGVALDAVELLLQLLLLEVVELSVAGRLVVEEPGLLSASYVLLQ